MLTLSPCMFATLELWQVVLRFGGVWCRQLSATAFESPLNICALILQPPSTW